MPPQILRRKLAMLGVSVGTSFAHTDPMQSYPRLVRDIMTRSVVTLSEENNVELADQGMKDYRFRHLPVVDGDRLVGLVTDRDVLRASVSTLDEQHAQRDHAVKRYFFVREIMTTDVLSARPDMLLLDAARLMKDKKLGCLPVVDDRGRLVGIVTECDFVKLSMQFLHDVELRRLAALRDSERP